MAAETLAPGDNLSGTLLPETSPIPVRRDRDFSLPSTPLLLKHARSVRQRKKVGRPRGDPAGLRLLPSADQFKFDPGTRHRLNPFEVQYATPVNEHGLVQTSALIKLIKSTVVSSHKWSREITVHHIYDPAEDYERHPDPVAKAFRDLPVHKLVVPRSFENLLHLITVPPEMPSNEVMHGVVEAWKVTEKAFFDAKEMSWWDKRERNRLKELSLGLSALQPRDLESDSDSTAALQAIREDCRRGLAMSIDNLQAIDPVFQLVEVPSTNTDDYQLIATSLGRVAAVSALAWTESIPA